jgi:hypothetical protein
MNEVVIDEIIDEKKKLIARLVKWASSRTVSYTHLTLPTKLL